jgi:hypothetical protein
VAKIARLATPKIWLTTLVPGVKLGAKRTTSMKDYQAQLEKLRTDAAECALIRDLATEPAKRELFNRLANHLSVLADQVEMAMLERKTG